jgi:hypothetical protein
VQGQQTGPSDCVSHSQFFIVSPGTIRVREVHAILCQREHSGHRLEPSQGAAAEEYNLPTIQFYILSEYHTAVAASFQHACAGRAEPRGAGRVTG